MFLPFANTSTPRRRAATAVFVAVTLMVTLGFASLTIDVGLLYNAKADLQRAADAAALAGASAYVTTAALAQENAVVEPIVVQRAIYIASQNPTLGTPTVLATSDVVPGYHDFDNPGGPILTGGALNAVQATARRTGDSPGGPIPLLFAAIWGKNSGNVSATARAAYSDHFAGYNVPDGGLLPFTIHEDIYADRYANGPDDFSYDDGILQTGDGVSEITLYPWNWKTVEDEVMAGLDGEQGSGNFGTLNIGLDSQSLSNLEDQIRNGITTEQLETEFGTSDLIFYDENGDAQTYTAGGNPGLSVGMKDGVESRLGQVIGFFLHSGVYDNGSGAYYVITSLRYGRIMEVRLTGNPDERAIVVQPVPFSDSNVIVDDGAPSTGGQMGSVVLVQ